jgi:hypothetical protein
MSISFTRFSAAVVIALQWLAVIIMMLIGSRCERIFSDFSVTLPDVSVVALQGTKALVLVPMAMLTTAIVVIAESLLQWAKSRFVIQAIVACSWFGLTCFCIIALLVPVFTTVEKLR